MVGFGQDFDVLRTIVEGLKRSCSLNDPKGCSRLSEYLMMGMPLLGKPQSKPKYERALPFAVKACELGVSHSCYNAAMMYKRGDAKAGASAAECESKYEYYENKRKELLKKEKENAASPTVEDLLELYEQQQQGKS